MNPHMLSCVTDKLAYCIYCNKPGGGKRSHPAPPAQPCKPGKRILARVAKSINLKTVKSNVEVFVKYTYMYILFVNV